MRPLSRPTCPDVEFLCQLQDGDIEAAEAELVLQHLESCPDCIAKAAKVPLPGWLTQTVSRRGATLIDSRSKLVAELVQKIQAIQPISMADYAAVVDTANFDSSPKSHASDLANLLSPPQAPGELGRLEHYRILRVLGRGGMGVVFEAEDSALRRRVAIKVINPDRGAAAIYRKRFLREARATAQIRHERIVTIY